MRRALGRRSLLALGVALVAAAIVGALWWSGGPAGAPSPAALDPRYVDNAQCLGCHPDQAQRWQSSHHASAMAAPTGQSVRGDFKDSSFTWDGVTSRFSMRDGKYLVTTDGADGGLADFEVAFAFGVAPLQQYLLAMPGGRLQALQIAWATEGKRWFRLSPDEKTPPGDVLHWTGRYQTANTMCVTCHSTGFEKHYDAATDTFASRWVEPNVSCQACHGPGSRHVTWAAAQQRGEVGPVDRGLLALTGRPQVDTCAACHSRRGELVANPEPGQPRLDTSLPALLTEGLYHPDGQQLDEAFVDGSFRQSRMYAMGVTCTDCHDAHVGGLKLAGNAGCTRCHASPGDPRFPTAAGVFDSPAHHFHPPGSPGAQCVGCHMPAKNYLQLQARPDHSLRVPRPDLTVKLGTPNACNGCHADKSAQWATERVAAWYGPGRRQEAHFGETFSLARAGRPEAVPALARLVADPAQPSLVRATALDALRADPGAALEVRVAATRDVEPEVRAAAADSLESVPADRRLSALRPLLSDPVRAVRIAAARALSSLPPGQLGDEPRQAFESALAEYIAAQTASLDMPGPRLNLAIVYANTGRPALAEQHGLAALRIDPDFTQARAHLANLYNAAGRNADAERVLKEGLARQPALGELQYSLGLLLGEEGRLPEAADALAKAAALLPARAHVHYNLGLALQHLGQRAPAEAALLKAWAVDPGDAAIAYALAVLSAQEGKQAQARSWAERSLALSPGDPQARRLLESLRGGN